MYKNNLIADEYEQFADKRAYVQMSINNLRRMSLCADENK